MAKIEHFTIDADHSNAYSAWLKMGSPLQPTREQYAELERSGHLVTGTAVAPIKISGGAASVRLALPRQAVSLLVIHGDGSVE
jgi:xylan 1,4-beta-xylosidase